MRSLLATIAVCLSGVSHALAAAPDLSRWKLTLPIDADHDGRADELADPGRAEIPPWFRRDGQTLVFHAHAGGARTSANTAFARSELREMQADGRLAAWDCLGARRSLLIEQTLVETTLAKPEASIGQIHDARNDNLMILYKGPEGGNGRSDSGRIELRWNNAASRETLDEAYALGQPMRLLIAAGQGVISVSYRNLATGADRRLEARLDPATIHGACYFKAGLYVQACSRVDAQGLPNEACARKGWPDSRYDRPDAAATLSIRRLLLDQLPGD